MALPFNTVVEMSSRADRTVVAASVGYDEVSFSLDDDPRSVPGWARYVAGMAQVIAEEGIGVSGFDASIRTDIPVGAALSSSAALEVAIGFALCGLAEVSPDPVRIAQLGQRVENEIIGIQSGIMDQLIVAVAEIGTATHIDCRSLQTDAVAIPDSVRLVIMDTMTRRELADSEYDLRRAACERAAASLGVSALRDTTSVEVEAIVDPLDRQRAIHVVTENDRVGATVDALGKDDVATVGELMNESHRSLSVDYEVSSAALDAMAEIGREHRSCYGARMTGGGFAGNAVALVDAATVDEFVEHVRSRWLEEFGVEPDLHPVAPSAGASVQMLSD